jgi:hypothetical protein
MISQHLINVLNRILSSANDFFFSVRRSKELCLFLFPLKSFELKLGRRTKIVFSYLAR